MARNLVNIEEVSKAFDIRALLERVSLGVSEGDRIGIVGRNGSGKSTLMNAILGEKLAIVSHKVQTTRHRIMGIWNEGDTQIVFSDTPGIIEPEYLMHKRMMTQVAGSVKDADVIIFMFDVKDDLKEATAMLEALHLKVPVIVIANKIDTLKTIHEEEIKTAFAAIKQCKSVLFISALQLDCMAFLSGCPKSSKTTLLRIN